jgi:cytochrome c-type biogenesis protein CcmH/NrfG
LRDITAKEPAIFGYRLAYGQVLMNHRKYAEAKVALASVHEQWPESLDVALALLRATRQADGDAAAEAFLSRLLRKHPSNTRVALELAKLQFDLKEYESSLDLFRGVLAAEPDNLDAQRGCEAAERQLAGD